MRWRLVYPLIALAACRDDPGSTTPEIAGATLTTDEDAPISHTALATDPAGRVLALSAQPPMHGTAAVDGLRVTYTPGADYHGPDAFTVTVTNGERQASARIHVTVGPVNDPPVVGDDAFSATEDLPLVRTHAALLANDRDADGDALAVTGVQNAVNGTAVLGADSVTFTPDAGFVGAASFESVVGVGADTDVGTVMVTVAGCGDGVLAPASGEQCDDGNTAGGDGCSATCQLERLAVFTFTGAAGDELVFPADGAAPPPGLATIPTITRGPGLDPAAAPDEFSSELWTVLPAVDPDDYYELTITPAAGFTVSLLGIELDERRSPSGPLFWSLRSSLDGFSTDLAMFALPDDSSFRRDQLVLLGPAFHDLTAPVDVRIYGWDSEGSLGTWRLDNVEILGFTTGP